MLMTSPKGAAHLNIEDNFNTEHHRPNGRAGMQSKSNKDNAKG